MCSVKTGLLLNLQRLLSEPIHDLDWTSTPDMQSVLAVGFLHHVELLCQQRMTYFDEGPGWATCTIVEIGKYVIFFLSTTVLVDFLFCRM